MKIFIVLLIISFNVMNLIRLDESDSIEDFLERMENEGVFNTLKEIKDSFGSSVAIETCIQIYNSNYCEVIVNSYMEFRRHGRTMRKPVTKREKKDNYIRLKEMIFSTELRTHKKRIIADKVGKKFKDIFYLEN